jgi:hypothetical protein
MTLRVIFGLGWSLTMGLAGGWLVLAPWALGVQGGGDWTTVTKSEFGAGIGLVVLALAGIVVVATQTVRALREAGALAPARASSDGADGAATSPDMERALIALAQALAEDLDAHKEPSRGEVVWRQQS